MSKPTKKHITAKLDITLINALKKLDINVSETIRDALKKALLESSKDKCPCCGKVK